MKIENFTLHDLHKRKSKISEIKSEIQKRRVDKSNPDIDKYKIQSNNFE